MKWLKARAAATEWAGGVSPKLLYRAVRAGSLKAARIGAGRHLLFCEEWVNEWLVSSAGTHDVSSPSGRLVRKAVSEGRP